MRRRFTLVLLIIAALSLSAVPVQARPGDHADTNRLLAQVRQATAAYHDVEVARDAGYGLVPGSGCVPNMGYHYARGVAASADDLDPLDPEILVYAPRPNGSLRLVAVEYASWQPAELFGETFADPAPPQTEGPPFYTLHAWVWQGNPLGTFSPYNPNISCD